MAKKISLTPENIKALEFAFDHFFPNGTIFTSNDIPFSYGNLEWKSRKEFTDDLSINSGFEVKPGDYKGAKGALDKIEGLASKVESESKNLDSNTLSPDQLKQFQEEAQIQKEKIKQTEVNSQKNVEAGIKRQQEIYRKLAGKKVVVTPTQQFTQVTLTNYEKSKIYNLAKAYEADPATLQKIIEQKIQEAVNKSSSDVRQNVTEAIIKQAAADLTGKVKPFVVYKKPEDIPDKVLVSNPVSPIVAITDSESPQLKKIIPDDETRNALAQNAKAVAISLDSDTAVKSALIEPLFEDSKNITQLFYPKGITEFQIAEDQDDQETKDEGAEINFDSIYDQGQRVRNVWQKIATKETSVEEVIFANYSTITPFAITTSSSAVTGASLFAGAALPVTVGAVVGFKSSVLASKLVSRGLLGTGTPLLNAVNVASIGNSIIASSSAVGRIYFQETIGKLFFGAMSYTHGASTLYTIGASYGEKLLNIALLKTPNGTLIGTLTNTAGKIGFKALPAAVSNVVNKVAGFLTAIGPVWGAIIGAAVTWIASKIDWKKVGPYLVGGVVALGVGIVAGLGVGLAAGIGAGILASGAIGGLPSVAAIGSSVAGVFGAIASATIAAIGTPILVTILSFPVVVALLLFIINSGAYVVPPSTNSTFIGNIQCSLDKEPTGINYSVNSPVATRALHIVDDLYQGFWCFWNRPPEVPPVHFPKDVLLYPPSYPYTDFFDYQLYFTNPNPSEDSEPKLFWCTYLVIMSYTENKVPVPIEAGAQTMFDKWPNKTISADQASPSNITPGSVVFFHVTTGHGGLNHVGMVYSVDPGGIVIVESNAPLKTQTISFNSSGIGVGDLPLMEVKEFGLP